MLSLMSKMILRVNADPTKWSFNCKLDWNLFYSLKALKAYCSNNKNKLKKKKNIFYDLLVFAVKWLQVCTLIYVYLHWKFYSDLSDKIKQNFYQVITVHTTIWMHHRMLINTGEKARGELNMNATCNLE